VPTWSTCLRQIAFLHSDDYSHIEKNLLDTDEIYRSDLAFRFLLEVVCGLKSPLIAETEVQGQFKIFLQETSKTHQQFWGIFSGFFQNILSASKHVRTEHLKDLGSQSYGSLIRRRLKADDSVTILGAGQLAEQILPWLKSVQSIYLNARTPVRAEILKSGYVQVQVKAWNEVLQSDVIVVAASITNHELIKNLKTKTLPTAKLIDLRGEASLNMNELKSLQIEAKNYESLSQLMKEIDNDQAKIFEQVSQAKISIQKCTEAFINKVILRPGGWEDLCG